MERVAGVEPASSPWKGDIIAAIRYPRESDLIIGEKAGLIKLPAPKMGEGELIAKNN